MKNTAGATVYDAVSGRARKKRTALDGDATGQPIAADDLLAATRTVSTQRYLDFIRVYENRELPDSVCPVDLCKFPQPETKLTPRIYC